MKILGELKRRNVYRAIIIYGVASWILVQIGDITARSIHAPDWAAGVLLVVLTIGYPFAIWFAWTYEMTPEGLKKTSNVPPDESINEKTAHKMDQYIMVMLVVVAGVATLEKFVPEPEGYADVVKSRQLAKEEAEPETPPEPAEPLPPIEENTIAVLPFVNMSDDSSQDYFSDGMSEELLNVLVGVDGLQVASRTSSFAFKDHDQSVSEIAEKLRVANVLEGSVRKSGNRLRVTAQLIDGSNDQHLWSQNYDREMDDIFLVQDEIANAIVLALKNEMGVGLSSVTVQSATSSLDAYDLYLQARELFIAREKLPTSWALLEKATGLDPEFARAWEALAAVHSVANSWFPGDGIDHTSLAMAAAHRALELDPGLSMPHAVIGLQYVESDEGYAGAIERLDQAIENDPKNATIWLWRGITLKDMGYLERAEADLRQCLAVDPGYLNCQQFLAETLLGQGRVEEAISYLDRTIEANFHSVDDAFVSYYVYTGQRNMALMLASLAIRNPFAPVKDWIEAIENPDEDQSGRIASFNKWGEAHNLTVCEMFAVSVALRMSECFPAVDNRRLMWQPDTIWYRNTPEFKEFVNTHLMAYWTENGFPLQCRSLADGDFECD